MGGSRSAGSGKEIVGGSQRTALNNCLRRQSQEVLSRKSSLVVLLFFMTKIQKLYITTQLTLQIQLT